MFEYDEELLDKIRGEKTLAEMAMELNIPMSLVHSRVMNLQNKGFVLKRLIYDDGNVRYCLQKNPKDKFCSMRLKLSDRFKLSAMVISDLHIGNELQCIDYLETVYDYCRRFGIHIIINGGDLIDGTFSNGKQIMEDPIKQLEYVIKNHPFDEQILNLICLGNHDYSLYKNGIDMKEALENARSDLIPFGFGLGILNIESDQIFIRHSIQDLSFFPINKKLVLEGHRHKMAFTSEGNGFLVNIPTLSNLTLGKYKFPGAIRMDLFLNNDGYIDSGHFEHFMVADELSTVNEAIFKFDLNHNVLDENEVRPKVRCRQYNGQSQVDKFNQKWKR